jgi:hypothetical protein
MTKKLSADFNVTHRAWLKAQGKWRAVAWNSENLSQSAYDRLVSKTAAARQEATKKFAAVRARDSHQLACKTDALWDMLVCDFKTEADAMLMGDLDGESFGLIKSIRRDADQLAKKIGGAP